MKLLNPFKKLVDEVKDNIDTRIDLAKVQGVKKASHISTQLTFIIVLMIFLLLAFFYFGLALAFFFSSLFESNTFGFLLAGGIPFLFALILLLFRNKIQRRLRDFFIHLISESNDEEDQ